MTNMQGNRMVIMVVGACWSRERPAKIVAINRNHLLFVSEKIEIKRNTVGRYHCTVADTTKPPAISGKYVARVTTRSRVNVNAISQFLLTCLNNKRLAIKKSAREMLEKISIVFAGSKKDIKGFIK
jgi:hypothetical protein